MKVAEVYVAICQDQGDRQARVVFHAYSEDGACKEVARYVPGAPNPNQTVARAVLTALERLQKNRQQAVVYTNLKAAVPSADYRPWPGAEGFQALVGRIHRASVERLRGCMVLVGPSPDGRRSRGRPRRKRGGPMSAAPASWPP